MTRRMTEAVGTVLTLALVLPAAAHPADHIVAVSQVKARLDDAAQRRAADLHEIREFLGSPAARAVSRAAGADATALQASVALLSDADAKDLACRARALKTDPVAGELSYNEKLLLAVGVFYVVAFILFAYSVWSLGTHPT